MIDSTNAVEEYKQDRNNLTQRCLKRYKKYIGEIYGDYKVLEAWHNNDTHNQDWRMQCTKCGKIIEANSYRFRKKGEVATCDCTLRQQRTEKLREESKNHERWGKLYVEGDTVPVYEVVNGWYINHLLGNEVEVTCVECGRTTFRKVSQVLNGTAPACLHKERSELIDNYTDAKWIGVRRGNLVIEKIDSDNFVCRCDCGREVTFNATRMIHSNYKTCGNEECEFHAMEPEFKYHGLTKCKRLRGVYGGIFSRCYNPNDTGYKDYGGRGIKMCNEWLHDYPSFEKWALANGYDENAPFGICTIDRIDVNGNYEPSNCRWVDMKVQANNKRPRN